MIRDTDSQILKDSIITLKNQIESMQKQFSIVINKQDSLESINRDFKIKEDYFSDILSLQMDWFAIVFTATFGVLGLLYWFGILKYFNNKFQKIESDKEAVDLRISSLETSMNEKINKNDASIREFYNEKHRRLEEKISNLDEKVDESVEKSYSELKELIANQKVEFNSIKNSLIKKITDTNFDSHRAMFFNNLDNKSFSIALAWAVGILKLIIIEDADADSDQWLVIVKECIQNIKSRKEIEESYDDLNNVLSEIKSHIEEEKKALVDELIHKLNQIYYSVDSTGSNEKATS